MSQVLQYFPKSSDKQNEMREHIILEKLGFFKKSCLQETTAGGIFLTQYVVLYSFYTRLLRRSWGLVLGCP